MATLTKKDLLEAIEDMPMDTPIILDTRYWEYHKDGLEQVILDKDNNWITLC